MKQIIAVVTLAMIATACSGGDDFTGSGARKPRPHVAAGQRTAPEEKHQGMAIDFTGDTDTDFILAMIPHHRSAVDMARAELAHGQDPEVRALAKKILDTQSAELTQMRAWFAKRRATKGIQPKSSAQK